MKKANNKVESLNTFTTELKHRGFKLVEKEPDFRLYIKKTSKKENHICIQKDFGKWCLVDSSWFDPDYEPVINMTINRMNSILKNFRKV